MQIFSEKLELLLSDKKSKSLKELIYNFSEKSFAILFLILMAIPALPLPTGGVTHIFEIIAMLLALEQIAGRKTVWLPDKWLKKSLPIGLQSKALPRFIKIIKWVEKYSKPRLRKLLIGNVSSRIIGIVFFIFIAFAFLAPPFSGLDTLPSLGVVFLSLAIIFEDFILFLVSIVTGCIGIILIFTIGKIALQLF